jgi:hypothetical protein
LLPVPSCRVKVEFPWKLTWSATTALVETVLELDPDKRSVLFGKYNVPVKVSELLPLILSVTPEATVRSSKKRIPAKGPLVGAERFTVELPLSVIGLKFEEPPLHGDGLHVL